MYLAGDMIVLSAGKYLFVWDPILCWIGIMLVFAPAYQSQKSHLQSQTIDNMIIKFTAEIDYEI
eukprot:COSAG02_NODE_15113_length_1202_cov_8.471442_1_plen_64_part_00